MKRRNVIYIRVLLVVLSIVILLAFVNRSPQRAPHDTWLPSSFNPIGAGNMAFFQTLQDLQWPVERWREPLGRLSEGYGTGNVLIIHPLARSMLAGHKSSTGQEFVTLLGRFVGEASGNTLVAARRADRLGRHPHLPPAARLRRGPIAGVYRRPHSSSRSNATSPYQTMQLRSPLPMDPGTVHRHGLVLPQSEPLPDTLPAQGENALARTGAPCLVDVPRGNGAT